MARKTRRIGNSPRREKVPSRRNSELPRVTVIRVTSVRDDGSLEASPASWPSGSPPPAIVIPASKAGRSAPGEGDQLLAKLELQDDGSYLAEVMRRVGRGAERVLGVYRKSGSTGRLVPIQKGMQRDYAVANRDRNGAEPGELVAVETLPQRGGGLRPVKVVERLGDVSSPRSISLIAIHECGIPVEFSDAAISEAENVELPAVEDREDLTDLPFITIDPRDARDHDDAIWAAPIGDPADPSGYELKVAIADVAFFVRPGSALDVDARLRGNSVYFPDRVVPMLPDVLSGNLCSLVEHENRAAMVAHLEIDRGGRLTSHRFSRAMIRCAGNVTYSEMDALVHGDARDTPDKAAGMAGVLFAAYAALDRERKSREPLAIEADERRIEFDADGHVSAISLRETLPSHKLVELFMILANVAAAETLRKADVPCMQRVHDTPEPQKVAELGDFLRSLDMNISASGKLQPKDFNRVLESAKGTPHFHAVNEVILRTQSRAVYAPDDHGHFGLNLRRYAHFTSPIRRYADVLVHRALITACHLGRDGLSDGDRERFSETATDITETERRAMQAERSSTERYVAAYMSDRVGAEFEGRITGVARPGLFIELEDTGADGFVPMRSLGDDYYSLDEVLHQLKGRRTGTVYKLGQAVRVRLVEATPLTGGLRLELLGSNQSPGGNQGRKRRGRQR